MSSKARLRESIVDRALELGFVRCAFVSIEDEPETFGAFRQWLAENRHGEMTYMAEQAEPRGDAEQIVEGAKTAIVCLARYGGSDEINDVRVARYAQGDDYHDVLGSRLEQLAEFVRAESGATQVRRATDILPILERDLARAAGLGWLGKNALLIDQEIGSYTFVSSLITDVDLGGEVPVRHPDRCGTCHRCIDVCPTNAIAAPGLIDARRCISYLTIELRGPIPRPLRPLIGNHLFGCDLCQSVCPWNDDRPTQDDRLARRSSWNDIDAASILRMRHEDYAETFRGSAVKRARYDGLLRNAAVVLGNSGDPQHLDVLIEQLWESEEPLVRGHIAWALSRFRSPRAASALANRSVIERDPYVLEEIRWSLSHYPAA